jgi:xanthine dehydrogenase YagS FAD-binding subunit
MRPFEMFMPGSLEDACKKAGATTAFKAAGIDLVDRLKERVESPATVIDLLRMKPALASFEEKDGVVTLGALTTIRQIESAPFLQGRAFAALRDAAATTATPQVRNRATLGGNLLQKARCWYLRSAAFNCAHSGRGSECFAMTGENRYHSVLGWQDCIRVHPSNLAPALLALGAQILVQGTKRGIHNLPLDELFPKQPTAAGAEHTLEPDEVLVFVQIKKQPANSRSAYRDSREKLSFDWPTTAAAVRVELEGKKITKADVVLGAVAPRPIVARAAADLLQGKEAGEALFRECARAAYADARPLMHNAYKVQVGQAVLVDALLAATKE